MIDYNIITPALFNVLSWKNTLDTCEKPLDPSVFNGTSQTGMYYNLNSELLSLENLQAIAPNSDLFSYNTYDAGVTYNTGDIIRYDKLLYKSLVDSNTGNQPDTNTSEWQLLYPFSEYLFDFTNCYFSERTIEKLTDKMVSENKGKRISDLVVKVYVPFDKLNDFALKYCLNIKQDRSLAYPAKNSPLHIDMYSESE